MGSGADGESGDAELVTRLRVAVGRIARQLRQSHSGGLTGSQLSALFAIEQRGSVRLGDLAAVEGVAPSTLSRIVSSLEEAALVTRVPDPDDRRSAWISLSADGRQVITELRTERTLLLSRRVAALDETDRRALLTALPALERLAGELAAGEPGLPPPAGSDAASERPASRR
ncbi:MAG: MarR family winged helix-turn-helix transcriptional regulator [Frankiaceae bacterium]